jgi:hypothetical protein
MPEMRLPFNPGLSAQARAEQAFGDALEAFDTPREALEGVAGYIRRMKEGRRSMAYDSRWRGAWDQGGEMDPEAVAAIEQLLGKAEETYGIDMCRDVARRRYGQAMDQPPSFQGKPLVGGGQVPTTGTLSVDPSSSKSANAASAQDSAIKVGSFAPYNKRFVGNWQGRLG